MATQKLMKHKHLNADNFELTFMSDKGALDTSQINDFTANMPEEMVLDGKSDWYVGLKEINMPRFVDTPNYGTPPSKRNIIIKYWSKRDLAWTKKIKGRGEVTISFDENSLVSLLDGKSLIQYIKI